MRRWGILAGALLAVSCNSSEAPDAPEGRQFDAAARANGDHCLGDMVPSFEPLGIAVMNQLAPGEAFDNHNTFTRGFDRGQRQVVMEFVVRPSGRKGAAIALLDPKACTAGPVEVRFARQDDAGYPIAY